MDVGHDAAITLATLITPAATWLVLTTRTDRLVAIVATVGALALSMVAYGPLPGLARAGLVLGLSGMLAVVLRTWVGVQRHRLVRLVGVLAGAVLSSCGVA